MIFPVLGWSPGMPAFFGREFFFSDGRDYHRPVAPVEHLGVLNWRLRGSEGEAKLLTKIV